MDNHERAQTITKDILVNHLPRVLEGLQKGYVDENQILVIYDHAVRARILTEQTDAIPRSADTSEWRTLSRITHGNQLTELLAATCDDGIGVIARWTRREDGGWDVEAMDTEGTKGMERVTDFSEGECVPPEPPELTRLP